LTVKVVGERIDLFSECPFVDLFAVGFGTGCTLVAGEGVFVRRLRFVL
jgi:hypothetical protein